MTFASISFHSGNRLSRRDDLESLSYLLIYLTHGSLPWIDADIRCNDDILKLKTGLPTAQFCKTLPSPFITFLLYARQLLFTQKPDYDHVVSLFRSLQSEDTPLTSTLCSPGINILKPSYWVEGSTDPSPLKGTPQKRVHKHSTPCRPSKRYVNRARRELR